MKNTFWIYLFLFTINFSFSQGLQIKKAELLVETAKPNSDERVQLISKDLDIIYLNNNPEIVSKGNLSLSSLKTSDVYLQELINDYSNTNIEFNMVFKNDQFLGKSNLESSFKSVIEITINNIIEEIPVEVIVSNSKGNQKNYYFIVVNGRLLLSKFDVEISSIEDEIVFSYRQNVEVSN